MWFIFQKLYDWHTDYTSDEDDICEFAGQYTVDALTHLQTFFRDHNPFLTHTTATWLSMVNSTAFRGILCHFLKMCEPPPNIVNDISQVSTMRSVQFDLRAVRCVALQVPLRFGEHTDDIGRLVQKWYECERVSPDTSSPFADDAWHFVLVLRALVSELGDGLVFRLCEPTNEFVVEVHDRKYFTSVLCKAMYIDEVTVMLY